MPEAILGLLDHPENSGLRGKFDLGIRNARGITSRGPYDGGAPERALAANYRKLSARYGNSHPCVSSMLVSRAEGYEWDAKREDEQATVGERWHP